MVISAQLNQFWAKFQPNYLRIVQNFNHLMQDTVDEKLHNICEMFKILS